MSEDQKPTITVTRGTRKERRQAASKTEASPSGWSGPFELASGLFRRAQSVWWAGLGALSVAEEAGTKIFKALVEEGKSWEQSQRERSEQTAKRIETLSKDGVRAVEAVEERVRSGVNETLHRLGVPHRNDVDELRDKIDALTERINQLSRGVSDETPGSDQ